MKTIEEHKKELESLESVLGFNPAEIEQGSEQWLKMKVGVISASEAAKVIAKKTSATRATYLSKKVAEVCTGEMKDINSKHMAWGLEHEQTARNAYAFQNNVEVFELPFIYKDAMMRSGCSVDGLVENKGLEIKCPFTTEVFIEFATNEKMKKEYVDQCQFSMWITDAEAWDFMNYDPRMLKKPMHTITIERDDGKMRLFDDAVSEFVFDMDVMLGKLGYKFGDQWKINGGGNE